MMEHFYVCLLQACHCEGVIPPKDQPFICLFLMMVKQIVSVNCPYFWVKTHHNSQSIQSVGKVDNKRQRREVKTVKMRNICKGWEEVRGSISILNIMTQPWYRVKIRSHLSHDTESRALSATKDQLSNKISKRNCNSFWFKVPQCQGDRCMFSDIFTKCVFSL